MNAKANQVKLGRTVLIGAAIIVAVLLLVALLVALGLAFRWYLNPENKLSIVQRRDLVQGLASARQALAVFLTGAVGLTGLFFTWRNTRLARESTQETLDLTRRGQITERFTQAINQLGATEGGDKSLEIRLGGIYSLERTAREDRDYHWPIMEVLTTYIRQHAPRKPDKGSSEEEISSPDPNIQAILTVIGRRSIHHREVEYGQVDLHSTDLRRADLKGADLKGADLKGADLRETTDLTDAQLERAFGDQYTQLPDGFRQPASWT